MGPWSGRYEVRGVDSRHANTDSAALPEGHEGLLHPPYGGDVGLSVRVEFEGVGKVVLVLVEGPGAH
jgi:hypothetical protein